MHALRQIIIAFLKIYMMEFIFVLDYIAEVRIIQVCIERYGNYFIYGMMCKQKN
jgi:hypothetical protein